MQKQELDIGDEVINVSGHQIGARQVEFALVSHPQCTEVALVGVEHEAKGQGIYAFLTLVDVVPYSDELEKATQQKSKVRKISDPILSVARYDGGR